MIKRLILYAVSMLSLVALQAAEKPNVLVLYLDDLGYGDVQYLNPDSKIPTPSMDQLASEGMSFTDAHSAAPICGPSRYGLLTGQYPWRRGASGVGNGAPFSSLKIAPERQTVADMFKGLGYNTAQMGKWGLRHNFADARKDGVDKIVDKNSFDFPAKKLLGANLCGFDYSWVLSHLSNDKDHKYVFINGLPTGTSYSAKRSLSGKENPPYQTIQPYEDVLPDNTQVLIDYLEAYAGETDSVPFGLDRDKPFFIYWDPPVPHTPIAPAKAFIGTSGAGAYGDYVVETDDAIGRILETLRRCGLEENTVVIFASDNGPENTAYPRIQQYDHYSMGELRGLKRDSWEGGTRVPLVVKWQGNIAPGTVCDVPVGIIDIYATLAEMMGASLALDDAPDSNSFLPLLRGEAGQDRPPIVYHTGRYKALRKGDWVYLEKTGMGSTEPDWFREQRGVTAFDEEGPELFNLSEDPQQLHNLAATMPEKTAEMREDLARFIAAGRCRPPEDQ